MNQPDVASAGARGATWNATTGGAIRIASAGHAFFAVTMIALGIHGLIKGQFTPIWTGVFKGFPARETLPYLVAIISLVCGIGFLVQRTAAAASRVLLGSLLVWLVLFRASHIFLEPTGLNSWWASGDTAVMVGAAWVLYAWFAGEQHNQRPGFATGDKGLRIARVFYGLGLIPFGVAHFVNLKGTVGLVPGWLPWHLAWAYLTGVAFIAAGVAVLIGAQARLAAMLSTLQMGLFTVLVWMPIVLAGANTFQWTEFVSSWTLTAAAWVVTDSWRAFPGR